MSKNGHGVSSRTHTQQQINHYSNQHNPNNKAYKAKVTNQKQIKKQKGKEHPDYVADLDWMCFSKGPYEFD